MANFDELDSLSKLGAVSSSGEVSKVKHVTRSGSNARVSGGNAKVSRESKNLLSIILEDSAAAAEVESLRNEEKKRRADEEARIAKEIEEERTRLEAEQQMIAEKQAQADLRNRQAEMQAQLQRQKDIEAGLIDLEEEARIAREEEARRLAEEQARAKKAADKHAATELRMSQETELEALRRDQLARESAPAASRMPLVIGLVVTLLLICGGVGAYWFMKPEPIDIYALSAEEETRALAFLPEDMDSVSVDVLIVKQMEEVKEDKPRAKKAAAPAEAPKKKPTLGGGLRGGLFGGGRL